MRLLYFVFDFSEDSSDAGGREDLHWLSRSRTRTANIVVTLCWEYFEREKHIGVKLLVLDGFLEENSTHSCVRGININYRLGEALERVRRGAAVKRHFNSQRAM